MLAKLEEKGLRPARPADKRISAPARHVRPDRPAAHSGRGGRFPRRTARRTLSPRWWTGCWPRRVTASAGAVYWLDVARYSDDKLNSTEEEPYPNAFRYRDWVIQAFNRDMPYDLFVKAQIAGDLLKSDDPLQYQPGLGFYALSPEMQDERVDATTRGFLA